VAVSERTGRTKKISKWISASEEFPENVLRISECEAAAAKVIIVASCETFKKNKAFMANTATIVSQNKTIQTQKWKHVQNQTLFFILIIMCHFHVNICLNLISDVHDTNIYSAIWKILSVPPPPPPPPPPERPSLPYRS